MRFLSAFCLVFYPTTEARRNLVRPHIRFLIQAVTVKPPTSLTTLLSERAVVEEKFCQPASLLLDSSNAPLPLYQQSEEIVVKGTQNVREELSKLGDAFRADDFRSSRDLYESVQHSIIAELRLIEHSVADEAGFYKRQGEASRTLSESAKTTSSSQQVEDFLFSGKNGKFISDADTYDLTKKAENPNDLTVIRSHSPEDWESIAKFHTDADARFQGVGKNLTELSQRFQNMFQQQLESIRGIGSPPRDYMIEWSSRDPRAIDEKIQEVSTKPVGSSASRQIEYKSEKPTGAVDTFDAEKAAQLGAYIVHLVAGIGGDESDTFTNFIKLEGSPAETMDRLSSTMNFLQIRRVALSEAKKSISDLLKQIGGFMAENRASLQSLMKELANDLESVSPLAKVVVEDVKRYPEELNVKIDTDDTDHYETYREAVKVAKSRDAIAETHPRINLLVNVAYRVHAHMLGFVNGLSTQISHVTSATAGRSDPVTSIISEIPEFEKFDKIDQVANLETLKSSLSKSLINARVASECLLYGRYDVLMKKIKLLTGTVAGTDETDRSHEAEKSWCGSTFALGEQQLTSV